nr:voltage dependent anion channel protein 2 [Hymenolepis microstoma]
MGPPSYSDIGKTARDVLRKNFDLGMRFISYKSKEGNYDYTARIDDAFRYRKMYGSFESTLFLEKYGVKIKEKLVSKASLSSEVSAENHLIKGLTNKITSVYDIKDKKVKFAVKSEYENEYVNGKFDCNFRKTLPDVEQSLVFRFQDYLAGAIVNLDSTAKKLRFVDFAFAYSISDFGFHAIITDWARTFTAGVYQRLSNTLEYAAEATWNRNESTHTWAVGCQYTLDKRKRHLVKLKLDSHQRVSASLKSRLKEGVKICVCALFNDADETQIGFGMEVEC